ncbi:MAG: M20 family metallo-hydrolase [Candidatus Competibacterales bacterium]
MTSIAKPTIDPSWAKRLAQGVDGQRLWQRHAAMAQIGAIPGGGVNRQALSAEDIQARQLLLDWVVPRDYEVFVDPLANLFIRRPGADNTLAPVLTGSHLDSQPLGGRFDGVYGVLAGLGVLEALDAAALTTRHPVELVVWTNEEGGRFSPGAMGSMVFTGNASWEGCLAICDGDGVRLADALEQTLAATPTLARRPFNTPVASYLEAHIEQGPVLEQLGIPVGIVTGIQGARWFTVEVTGAPAHAGTAPLGQRRDALQGAVAAIAALNELMVDPEDILRFTVGRFVVVPNAPNTVAEKVTFSIDLRHPDGAVLAERGDAIAECCRRATPRCEVVVTETFRREPCGFAPPVIAAATQAAEVLAIPHHALPSGAFHDAQFMTDVCPAGMVFVPCEKGISHNPAENAKPEDLFAGAHVLAVAVAALAGVG